MELNETRSAVWDTIRALNKAWTTGEAIDEISQYFAKNAVALVSSDRRRVEGKEACAAHWKDCSKKTIYTWQEIEPRIEIYGNEMLAVVSYEFNISLERDGKRVDATNRDSFALIKENGKWLIVLATV